MREIGDSSSAGSTPPPPASFDHFSPTNFFADYPVTDDPIDPKPGSDHHDDLLWKHLADDGWCFFSDNNNTMHDSHHQTFTNGRPTASEPLFHNNAATRRPPIPSSDRAKRKQNLIGMDRRDHLAMAYTYSSPIPASPPRLLGWDNSNGNPSLIQSLASENDRHEISSNESGSEDEIQSDLPENEKMKLPEVGMEFFSEEEAYNFYKKYAGEIGFAVRKGKVVRLTNRAIRKRNFLCSREGFKSRKMSSDKTTKYERKETRTGCEASIQLTVQDGKWVISNVVLEHNHELDRPRPSHDTEAPSWSAKTALDDGYGRVRQEDGTVQYVKLDRTSNDVQNLMNLFSYLQANDPSFFYAIKVDSQIRSKNFFWRDCRSRMDYSYFGDVLVLDTTCRVDNMVYALFWGLNHHQHCVLFGCALLLEETLDSFVWLLESFMVSMDMCQPRTLYSTEESEEISAAIDKVFTKAEHRMSVNSIRKNAKKQLPTYFEQPGFEVLFNKCISDCRTRKEFEMHWNSLLEQYNLRENPWLAGLDKLWKRWSHLFCKKTFSAGIELMLDSSVSNMDFILLNSSSEILTLPDFVLQYVNESKRRRSEEQHEDLRCKKTVNLRSRKGMEKHAEDLYTCTMFGKFQEELLDSLSLAIEEVTSSANISTFKLTEEGHKKEDIVTFDCSSSSVTCSCGKFESAGILCSHSIKVLNAKNIFQIPSQYIMKRWTKSAKEGDDSEDPLTGNSQGKLSIVSRNLMHKALNVISKSLASEDSRKVVETHLDLASREADDILKEQGSIEQINSMSNLDEVNYVRSQNIASNSSCINQDRQGSKYRLKKSMNKQRTWKTNARENESQSHGNHPS
ncbi:protein FAR1-RELATED SEQUENCE 7-like [Humulus lupulus]|uniref:protein FAR1-RELATED SEQUENCE 7-like n=1 Tax=Humulus lupulus TaxID=3486 RepID=UPI002B4085CF|nr:protein FAR1-RELATED SEQUENCE 7-like [Humulus lupulus]